MYAPDYFCNNSTLFVLKARYPSNPGQLCCLGWATA